MRWSILLHFPLVGLDCTCPIYCLNYAWVHVLRDGSHTFILKFRKMCKFLPKKYFQWKSLTTLPILNVYKQEVWPLKNSTTAIKKYLSFIIFPINFQQIVLSSVNCTNYIFIHNDHNSNINSTTRVSVIYVTLYNLMLITTLPTCKINNHNSSFVLFLCLLSAKSFNDFSNMLNLMPCGT